MTDIPKIRSVRLLHYSKFIFLDMRQGAAKREITDA